MYFVDNLLSCGFPTIRHQILCRYVKFYRSLLSSPWKEVAVLSRVVGQDASTDKGQNILNLSLETRLCPKTSPLSKFHEALSVPVTVPPGSEWTIGLLRKYLLIRKNQLNDCEDSSFIDGLINSLCSS